VELKASDPAPGRSLEICRDLGAEDRGTLWQRDTYLAVPAGRLKLREERPGGASLIHYRRSDRPGERESRYLIAPVAEPAPLLALLEQALGVRVVVTKRRRLFLWDQVRIHLDEVEHLGTFIEFEAVAREDSDLAHEHRLVARLRDTFEIPAAHLRSGGYADQLLAYLARD
jgi:adenylate cyclase class IV